MDEENRLKITLWLKPGIVRQMDGWLEEDNCKSRGEFAEKALRFYIAGYAGGQREPAAHFAVQAVRGGEHDGPHRGRTLPGGPGEPPGAAGLRGGRGAAHQREDQL